MTDKKAEYLYKILLIGDSSVGKTSLLMRFVDESFAPSYTATVGIDWKAKVVNLDGFAIRLQLWDTAGQERFNTLTANYYRGAMGVVLVYDITQPRTFKGVSTWISNVDEYASPSTCKLLVANKTDLYADREITRAAGEACAATYDAEYAEVSAKTGDGVDDAFSRLARAIKAKQNRRDMRKVLAGHDVDGLDLTAGAAATTTSRKPSGQCCR
ncbi:uncharacterized protein [Oscarella lobularis]|uniref:uncharacterized protein n=1 Tax=Oscarella lobularis TaxID=121494 RepID=UPI0033140B52